MKHLERFIGKVCTVFTVGINRDFKQENPKTYPKPLYVYFMGAIEYVNEHGIMMQQVTTGLSTFVFMNNIVSISEEEVLDPENEQDAEIIEKYKKDSEHIKKQYETQGQETTQTSEYLNVDSMSDLSDKIQKDIK